jgi:hypothetical protein
MVVPEVYYIEWIYWISIPYQYCYFYRESVIVESMSKEYWCKCTHRGKTNYSEKSLLQFHLVRHKFYMERPRIKSQPWRREIVNNEWEVLWEGKFLAPHMVQFDICLEEMRRFTKVPIWNRFSAGPKFEPKISWTQSSTNDCGTLHFCSTTYKILYSITRSNVLVL